MNEGSSEARGATNTKPRRCALDVLKWSLSPFVAIERFRDGHSLAETDRILYPLRYLRYWFVFHLIREQYERLGRPLRICEVGVDRGQMLAFMNGPPIDSNRVGLPHYVEQWDAVDTRIQPELLEKYGYTRLIEHTVGRHPMPDLGKYDVVIVLHFLEHLDAPEHGVLELSSLLNHGGVLVGGSPTMPDILRRWWEKRLRSKAKPFGHVSVISPARCRSFARLNGLDLEFLSGAFFIRASGRRIENSKIWLRLNVSFGALCPPLGSEIYFSMRRP